MLEKCAQMELVQLFNDTANVLILVLAMFFFYFGTQVHWQKW